MKSKQKKDGLRIAIAAFDAKTLRVMGDYFLECGVFSSCDAYLRGKTLLTEMSRGRRFDILVLDEQMQDMDLVEFMLKLWDMHLDKSIKPVILTLACREHLSICGELLSRGANYCIMKPYQMSVVARRAQMLYTAEHGVIKKYCEELYEGCGVQNDLTNCGYMTDAVMVVADSVEKLAIRKQVVLTVAELRGVSSAAVDSALRRLIDRMEENSTDFYRTFKKQAGLGDGRPTTGRILYAIKRLAEREANEEGD